MMYFHLLTGVKFTSLTTTTFPWFIYFCALPMFLTLSYVPQILIIIYQFLLTMDGNAAWGVWWYQQNSSLLGGLEPPTSRLTAGRANQLRHKSSTFWGKMSWSAFWRNRTADLLLTRQTLCQLSQEGIQKNPQDFEWSSTIHIFVK